MNLVQYVTEEVSGDHVSVLARKAKRVHTLNQERRLYRAVIKAGGKLPDGMISCKKVPSLKRFHTAYEVSALGSKAAVHVRKDVAKVAFIGARDMVMAQQFAKALGAVRVEVL